MLKNYFISFVVFLLTFTMVKDVFAEGSTEQVVPMKWVVTLEVADLTVQNPDTGEITTVQIPANQLLKVEKVEGELLFVHYNENAGSILKSKVRDATLWEIYPTEKVFKVIKDTTLLLNENGKLVNKGIVKSNTVFEKIGEKDQYLIIQYLNTTAYIDKNNTVPMPGGTIPVPTISIKAVNIKVGMTKRTSKIVNAMNKSYIIAEIPARQKIDIKGEYDSFYVVKIGGNTGLISKTNMSLKTNNYVNPSGNYSYNELTADLQELNAWYPSFTKVETIGKSVDGRNLYEWLTLMALC